MTMQFTKNKVRNKLLMLEATSSDGVELYDLDARLKEYRKYCNIGVRRLHNPNRT